MANFANRFALLNDEDDEPAPSPPPTKQQSDSAPTAKVNKSDKPARGGAARGGRGSYPGRGGPRNVFKDEPRATDEGPVGDDPVRDDRAAGNRGRGRGRGGPRGARGAARGGARGAEGRPDRHSQTDNVDSDKKEHQGWGGDEGKRELEDEDWGALDAKTEGAAQTPTKPSTEAGDNTPAATASATPIPEPEPEDNSKTYEEYLAERAAAGQTSVGGSLSARKANEGSDDSQWKAGQLLEKITTDNFFVGKQAQNKARKAKEDKRQFLEIEPSAYQPARREFSDRGGRGGGGRGRGEGGRGRGEGRGGRGGRGGGGDRGSYGGDRSAGRGGRSNGADVNLDDTSAFPSL